MRPLPDQQRLDELWAPTPADLPPGLRPCARTSPPPSTPSPPCAGSTKHRRRLGPGRPRRRAHAADPPGVRRAAETPDPRAPAPDPGRRRRPPRARRGTRPPRAARSPTSSPPSHDPDRRKILHRYLIWHLLRRLRSRNNGRAHHPATGRCASAATAARPSAFLDWLDAHNLTLATLQQADLDRWRSDDPRRLPLRDRQLHPLGTRQQAHRRLPRRPPLGRAGPAARRRAPLGHRPPAAARQHHRHRGPPRRPAPAALRPRRHDDQPAAPSTRSTSPPTTFVCSSAGRPSSCPTPSTTWPALSSPTARATPPSAPPRRPAGCSPGASPAARSAPRD